MAARSPTVDQFPTFDQVRLWLDYDTRQCIWYLPNQERCCLIDIAEAQSNIALRLISLFFKESEKCFPSMSDALGLLQQIAEHSCCTQYHRNKFSGGGLAQRLAIRWLTEILVFKYGESSQKVQNLKQEVLAIQSCCIPKTVKFIKHEIFEHQTLATTLYDPLGPEDDKDGLIYIYTHKQDSFLGMLKIGFTCSRILNRLNYWTKCGHGFPALLWSHTQVRHPRRVELLTHFELLEFWHEQQYCSFHNSSHVEWFKTDVKIATSIISDWSSWMESNPYDRRGNLKPFWEDTIDFLEMYEIPLTAKTMLQIHQLELGTLRVSDFLDDGYEQQEHSTTAANTEDKSRD